MLHHLCTLYNTCPLFATSSLQLSWCTCSIWWSNYYLPGYSSEFWGLFLFMPLKTVNHLSSNSWMCFDFFSLHSITCQHHQLPLHQYQLLARWMFSHQPLFQTLLQWDPQKPALLHWTQLKNRLIWIRYMCSILLNNHISSDWCNSVHTIALKKKIVKGDMYIGCKKKKLASPAVTFCIFLRTWIQLVELNKKYLEARGFNNSQVASISIHL